MKKHILATFSLASTLLLTSSAHAGGEGWLTDFEAAKKKASAENKDLLVDFTGSDWCGWCIKLSEEVFSKDEFKKAAPEKFVLVELDFPNDQSKMDEKTIAQNQMLAEKFQIQGYPTILLLDSDGLPYAKTGYQAGGPATYITHLNELQSVKIKRDEKFAEAAKLEGVEKAKALYAGLMTVPAEQHSAYSSIIEEIKTLDPEDVTGLKAQRAASEAIAKLEQEFNTVAQKGDMVAALKVVDTFIEKNKPQGKLQQEVLAFKIGPLMEMSKFDAVTEAIDQIVAIDAESEIGIGAANFKEQLPQIMESIKAQKAAEVQEKEAPAVAE